MDYFYAKGNRLYREKKFKEAIESYKKALIESENPEVLYNLGVCYLKLKEYKTALKYFNNAINLQKVDKYYFNVGFCYYELGQYEKAIINFRESLKLNPRDKDCSESIDIILKRCPELEYLLDEETMSKEIKYKKAEFCIEDDGKIVTVGMILTQNDLLDKIDKALEEGNKRKFMKFTKELKELLL